MSKALGRVGVAVGLATCVLLAPTGASAADWPAVKSAATVPACATPGRLMALAKARNASLDKRFETIASEYMRQGEEMGLRWDFAFYQMLVETNDLTFKKGVRGGAVRPDQNNFGGIGSMGGNEPGEAFASVADGVRAHLEHMTTYAGLTVNNALSERTRKFQTWDKFREIQAALAGRPATYADVIGQWAPKSRAYLDGVQKLADTFTADHCRKADPRPDLMSGVRAIKTEKTQQAAAEPKANPQPDFSKQAVATGKTEDNNVRTNLGAGLARAKAAPEVKIINEPPAVQAPAAPEKPAPQQTAVAAGAAAAAAKGAQRPAEPKSAAGKCRVWTASYGNDRALIIKAPASDGGTNFTVLDVNKGQETREADAYIAAYAKGGRVEGQFASQNEALDKAFELCPEG